MTLNFLKDEEEFEKFGRVSGTPQNSKVYQTTRGVARLDWHALICFNRMNGILDWIYSRMPTDGGNHAARRNIKRRIDYKMIIFFAA